MSKGFEGAAARRDTGVEASDGRLNLSAIPSAWIAGGLVGLAAVPIALLAIALFGAEAVTEKPLLLTLPLVAGLVLGVGIAQPRWVIPGMVAILIVMPIQLDTESIPLGFMRLYYGDLLLGVMALACCTRLIRQGWTVPPRAIPTVFWVWIGVGCWGLVNGFWIVGNEFDRVFGDFRRSVVYLTAFVGFLVLYGRKPDRLLLERGVLVGCFVIVAEGLWQALTGQFYSRRFTDAVHVLTKFELQFLAFGVLLALARLAAGRLTVGVVSLVGLGMLVTLLGNFRSAWLAMLGGMLYIFLYLPLRWRLLMLAWGSGVAVVAATVLALAWNVPVADGGSTLGEDLSQKMDVRSARFDPNVTWRFESYANAMALWAERPWLGQGLGVLTTFSAPTSTGGAQILYGHRVHNSLIWVLMTFGVVGAAVFAWWIGTVFWRFHWALVSNRLGLEDRTLVVACGAFVVSFLISTCFEIFLESGPPVLMLAAVLALGSAAAAEAHQQS